MKTFEFSIIASGLDPEADDFADRFFRAGCDDATISFQKGHIIVDFAREADSIVAAICSAIECTEKAGAHVNRLEPDPLVSLSDIAARTGLSRAAITNYSKGDRADSFPSPVARVTSKTSLYSWAAVAAWLFQHKQLSREEAVEAEAVRVANAAIESREPRLRETLRRSLKTYEAKLEKEAA
ncbi:helix-turn-helix transcriptional regulator [Bradyrhizobium sp.]|uniref:helix-turn-helix transcriptional regulator n=1 Tax=Bradyrhizobium sp. TaxID=376 RepID=UPI003C73DEF5